ncbi:spherulin-1B precursor [Ophiocordyceps sinensis CO18]|uniref:Spherulin-1B n=1 Tax=Ophiocordyceps sinensis (strain Co18 / CGMCC 3.14243) TaxID=911162 RepID=T5AML4_OPHSC|nr:spherulin-1B precursor [Ophiocordyceps sinensis CO18]
MSVDPPISLPIEPSIRLRRAIHVGDALLVRRLLKSHPSLLHNPDASPMGLSNSNLHLAASLGHRDICESLLRAGHEVPCPALNEHHQTALMLAARAGHTDVVHLLCETDRPSILRRDVRGRDAIMEASIGGHELRKINFKAASSQGQLSPVHRCDSGGELMLMVTAAAAVSTSMTQQASATVQAEVYLKGLVSEVERRQQLKRVDASKRGGAVRVVQDDGHGHD